MVHLLTSGRGWPGSCVCRKADDVFLKANDVFLSGDDVFGAAVALRDDGKIQIRRLVDVAMLSKGRGRDGEVEERGKKEGSR